VKGQNRFIILSVSTRNSSGDEIANVNFLRRHRNVFQNTTSSSAVADKPARRAASRQTTNFKTVTWP